MVSETSYHPQIYRELPGIIESYQRLVFRDRVQLIETELRRLFLDHGVENIFGVRLVHKHFRLRDNERMIQHGTTALPWDVEMAAGLESDGVVVPASWLFRDGSAYPYEFQYISQSQSQTAKLVKLNDHSTFISAYHCYLLQNGLTDVLGLFVLQSEKRADGDGCMLEINMDKSRASVNFPLSADDDNVPFDIFEVKDGQDVTVPAGWFFFGKDEGQMDACGRHRKCRHKCRCRQERNVDFENRYKTVLWI